MSARPLVRAHRRPATATARTSSTTKIDGAARTARANAVRTIRPAPSPCACTIRRRACAASRPSATSPAPSRSNDTPCRSSHAMQAGAARVTASVTAGSLRPAPAASVSAACRSGVSSAPSAAARPPCAQAVAASALRRACAISVTGMGARCSAVARPAMPAPTTITRSLVSDGTANSALLSAPRACARRRRARAAPAPRRCAPRASASRARGGCPAA